MKNDPTRKAHTFAGLTSRAPDGRRFKGGGKGGAKPTPPPPPAPPPPQETAKAPETRKTKETETARKGTSSLRIPTVTVAQGLGQGLNIPQG